MTRRLACLGAFLMLVFLPSFGFQDSGNAQNGLKAKSPTASPLQRRSAGKVSRAAVANWSRRVKAPVPPPTQIGFLSGTQTAVGGGTFPNFPAVTGDFKGDGSIEAAAIVNNNPPPGVPTYNIAVQLYQGNGIFTTKLTQINDTLHAEPNPIIFAGNLSGYTNGEDDILMVHPAAAGSATNIEAWISNGDGTFTSPAGPYKATTNGFVWATVDANGNVIVADAATPNANICTLTNMGKGVFSAPTCVPITGALNAGSSSVPGNPMVFADFGNGFLDFAAASAGNGGTIAANQIVVYLCSSKSNPCTAYSGPFPLATTGKVYDSCFLGGGPLTTGGSFGELVTANCLHEDDSITVYVDNAGTFAGGVDTTVGSDPVAVTVADVNGDGNTDIVASCFRSADIKILLGDGKGGATLGPVGYVTGGSPLVPPLVADFNGDGKPDVVVPDNEFSFVYLEGYGDGTFRSAVNYYATPGAGSNAQAVNIASGDFNGDGIPDFVIGNTNSLSTTGITVFLSDASTPGALQQGVNYSNNTVYANYSLQYVAVADFNGDKILDIAATDNFNGVVEVFGGKGDGTFPVSSISTYPTDSTASNPVGLIVGDFNGDGKPDLAVVNNYGSPALSAKVSILINNGKGGFNPAVTYALSTVATEITAADVNGDGKLDLVVPLYGTSTTTTGAVAILLGKGDGTFQPEADVKLVIGANTYLNPYDVAVGDLNGDGKVDLAVTIEDQTTLTNQGIMVALGNGDGTFQTPTWLASTIQNPQFDVPLPGYVKIVDLNLDGTPDLVYSNSEFSTVGILYGKGGGAFYDPVEFPADRWAWGLALVDFNGDGATDVVVSGNSFDFSGVAVLFNDGGHTTALTSSANPSTPGAPVTFTATLATIVKGVTGVPTGSVTFKDGSATLGTGLLSSSGVATFTANALADGPHAITAQYPGDANFVPSVSAVLNQSVGKADGVVSVTLVSSLNPSAPGQSVTFTATVADTVSGEPFVPTGTVTFNNGTTALGPGPVALGPTGVATLNTATLPAGIDSITAQYNGDANFAAKTSAPLKQTVLGPSYSLAATTASSVNPGSSASYKITQTAVGGYNGTVSYPAAACSGLPTGAACSFNPGSIMGSGTTTLTITTTAPTTAFLAPLDSTPQKGALNLWASLGGLGLVGVVLAGDWSSRKRRRWGTVLAVLAVMFLITLVGCGGGSSSGGGGGGGGGGGTPAGTYSISVSVKDGAGTPPTNNPLKVTLVVN